MSVQELAIARLVRNKIFIMLKNFNEYIKLKLQC